MGLFDFLRPAIHHDSQFGQLAFQDQAWVGEILVPEIHSEPLLLMIEAFKQDPDLSQARVTLETIRAGHASIRDPIARASFEYYQDWQTREKAEGLFEDWQYAEHPRVHFVEEIWNVLRPELLMLGRFGATYESNWSLGFYVNWPNDHGLAAYFNDLQLIEVEGV